ncbi:hypothetical protein [Flagellimonas halotolerans]|uniref:HNH endonuclease n=1 Tax=Flagellimonas halotolerans TaxID=3112164 RepID=A0ABU6IMY1_9FLAO|nr:MULTISPECIES: hypothetical protein [unclassified Allomuricauda]MEC3964544.1 hypothetical protein [Muricauda sp. SYSU M86414]MEC4264413.1 hypothetical protein [Muricauda sp. SYSU M84420]
MLVGICKLCEEEKKLIKTSHIISDFLHANLYDEKHKLRAFDSKDLKSDNPQISKPSSGSYEGGILCNKCDNEIIGVYETYISRVLKNNLKEKINCENNTNDEGLNFINVSNLDYKKTKLFLLSLLFRSHISSRVEYKEVNLGPYADKIRKQILENNPSKENDIEIVIFKFGDKTGFSNFIGQPRKHKIGHTTAYSIVINGHLILFHLKENSMSKKTMNQRLSEKGTISLIEIPEKNVVRFIMNYTGALN